MDEKNTNENLEKNDTSQGQSEKIADQNISPNQLNLSKQDIESSFVNIEENINNTVQKKDLPTPADIRSQDDSISTQTLSEQIKITILSLIKTKEEEHPFWELLKFGILSLIIVVPIRTFIAQPFIVSGSSMYPTFEDKQYLIVDQISYRFHEPERGDVIIFHYPKDPSKFFIKRVIGLPTETVKIENSKVIIKNTLNPQGFELSEPYVKNLSINQTETTLGTDEYFMMGDNRSASSDSRVWGNLPKDLIVGRAFVRLLPFNKIGLNPGEFKY